MSFSNKTAVTPVQLRIKWVGSKGHLTWWDKDTKDERIINSPVRFVVLDQLNTIGGYNKAEETGIWANEVRDTRKEPLTVRKKGGVFEQGLYNDIKDRVKAQGGKYARSVYILIQNESKEWVVGNIKLVGASVGVWFDYIKQPANDPESLGVELARADTEQNALGTYFIPVFQPFQLTDDLVAAATRADQQVQKYLSVRSNARDDDHAAVDEEDEAEQHQHVDDVVIEDIDDRPIDLSEIPF